MQETAQKPAWLDADEREKEEESKLSKWTGISPGTAFETVVRREILLCERMLLEVLKQWSVAV
jgi:Mg2+ and Co2+ transporter CorA